jgi:hypothetical protein
MYEMVKLVGLRILANLAALPLFSYFYQQFACFWKN